MATFEELKAKYAPVLKKVEEQGVRLQNLHVEDDKLVIRGAAPSDAAKNEVWTAIFEANKDQLKDPNAIKPGQVLKIPAA